MCLYYMYWKVTLTFGERLNYEIWNGELDQLEVQIRRGDLVQLGTVICAEVPLMEYNNRILESIVKIFVECFERITEALNPGRMNQIVNCSFGSIGG